MYSKMIKVQVLRETGTALALQGGIPSITINLSRCALVSTDKVAIAQARF